MRYLNEKKLGELVDARVQADIDSGRVGGAALCVVQDGKVHKFALKQAGYDEKWLNSKLPAAGVKDAGQLLFAFVSENTLHMQVKERWGGRVVLLDMGAKK